MKKIVALLLTLTLAMSMITACGKKTETKEDPTTTPTEAPSTEDKDDAVTTGALKTGLAVITSIGSSKNAEAEADGTAQVDSTVVAVIVDADGKIVACSIDAAQTKINFSKEGVITTDLATIFAAKQELGTDYGMSAVTGGKEWNEQATDFSEYVVGKTVEEVKGIAVTEKGAPSDADLAASVTIKIGGYVAAIEKAVANAKELGAQAGDKLGLGVTTSIAKSKDAAADAEGTAQAYTNYAAITTGADGKITSAVIEASQTDVKFDATGVVTSDLASVPQTKTELGDAYGMKGQSKIGKEWYEQIASLSEYVVGKTVEDVKGIAVDEATAPTDADLTATVTVKIGDYINVIDKAVANIK